MARQTVSDFINKMCNVFVFFVLLLQRCFDIGSSKMTVTALAECVTFVVKFGAGGKLKFVRCTENKRVHRK